MKENMRLNKLWVVIGILLLMLVGSYLLFNTETEVLSQQAKRTAPGEFLLLPQGEVHYRLVGEKDAPLIVLVHGFSVPSYVWDPTVSSLEEAGFQVLVYDLYGRGYSERIPGEYDISLFTNQLHDLLGALEIDGPVLIGGLSMGGPITARFAHLYPEQVSGVILISPEVTRPTMGDIFPLNLPLIGEYLMSVVMEPFLLPRMQFSDFVHPEKYPDWDDLYRVQLQYKGTGRALLSTIRNLTEHDPVEDYRELAGTGIPILLLWGEEDQTIGWEQIEILSQILSEIQIEILPDAGHLLHYERPEIANPLLVEFLLKHSE